MPLKPDEPATAAGADRAAPDRAAAEPGSHPADRTQCRAGAGDPALPRSEAGDSQAAAGRALPAERGYRAPGHLVEGDQHWTGSGVADPGDTAVVAAGSDAPPYCLGGRRCETGF